ncbi:MAG: EF-hand domain-containing protein [Anaerolineae bacterium]
MPSRSAPSGQDRLGRRFARADTNGDGYLSRSEFAAGFPRLARVFDRADRNHDGQLSEEEVRQFVQRGPGRRFAGRRQR